VPLMPEPGVDPAGAADDAGERTGPVGRAATARSLPARLRAVYSKRVGPAEQALMLSWAAFAATSGPPAA
jgi:hypothetical protein